MEVPLKVQKMQEQEQQEQEREKQIEQIQEELEQQELERQEVEQLGRQLEQQQIGHQEGKKKVGKKDADAETQGTEVKGIETQGTEVKGAETQSTESTEANKWKDCARDYGAKAQEQYQKLEIKAKDRFKMEGLLRQARESLNEFLHPKLGIEKQIPMAVLRNAKGIVFLTVFKAGLGFGAEMGCGLVMAKLSTGGWSPPLAIGAAGIKWGLQIGASKVDYIMVLFDDESVQTFTGRGQLKIGGDANVSVGPYGRDADVGIAANEKAKIAPILSYALAKGAYVGITLKGEVIGVRKDCNAAFYGATILPEDILADKVTMPENDDWSEIGALLDSYALGSDTSAHFSKYEKIEKMDREEQEDTEPVVT